MENCIITDRGIFLSRKPHDGLVKYFRRIANNPLPPNNSPSKAQSV